MTVENQVAILYAGVNGFVDDVPVEKVKEWENKFHAYMKSEPTGVLAEIAKKKELTPEIEEKLKAAITDFKSSLE